MKVTFIVNIFTWSLDDYKGKLCWYYDDHVGKILVENLKYTTVE